MLDALKPYRKTVTAVVGAAITWAGLVIVSEPSAISAAEWLAGAGGLATALGVYQVSNEPQA